MRTHIQYIKGIGPKKAEILKAEAGIETVEDLLYYGPRRYLDRSSFKSITDCFAGEMVTVTGTIQKLAISGRRRRFLEVTIDDGSDSLSGVFFAGIQYFQKIFVPGSSVIFSGKIEVFRGKQIVHPEFDFFDEDSRIKSIHAGRVIPLYRSTEKLKALGFDSRGFRRAIRTAIDEYLDKITDPVDGKILSRLNLPSLRAAIMAVHFPETMEEAEQARRRLAFNELFFMQVYLAVSRKYLQLVVSHGKDRIESQLPESFIRSLPFSLTEDQISAISEIQSDLERPFPMNRLLQGDVGSGKTVVSMAAALIVAGRNEQTAIMAPTEILASQHYVSFKNLLPKSPVIDLLTGNMQKKEKTAVLQRTESGENSIIIGTHALIESGVCFKKLRLIIIDEQHRFGVRQRALLREKGENPDLLIMTATPIPRSLALTLYGDLDVTSIRQKPLNRQTIKTIALPESRIGGVYKSVDKYINEGRQAYFVYPIIEESQKVDLKSAINAFESLKNDIFPHRRVELLHGRLPSQEKDEIMQRFKNGEIDILISTTVIEVGIDVANATIIVVQHSERFGLSQLHQLRGRVGRSDLQSFCVFIYPDDIGVEARTRIDTVAATDDGFMIAEADLTMRGSGRIIGFQQHGHDAGFEFTDLSADLDIIGIAREEAIALVNGIAEPKSVLESLKAGSPYGGQIAQLSSLRTRKVLSLLS
ncbi:MAG TPA: ATP-dependent DNA helicase RecG [Spirochaetota bacterium]|nr:ATP-dependent DNA helicase RecG [Spirochaetota bacterium]